MANDEHIKIFKKGVETWNTWRKENSSIKPNLSNSNLSDAYLVDANLSHTNMRNADLREAKLVRAYLDGADLRGADLRYADLRFAEVVSADLGCVNLSNARLERANLHGTGVSGACLHEAIAEGTIFADIDLSGVIALDAVEHRGPSSIGLDTFFKSKGKIPEVFLRGAGVPDIFLEYASSLAGKPLEFYSCFISYSHVDKPFARQLHDALQGRGVRCWLDEKQLLPGDQIHRAVDEAVRTWDKVLLCCSSNSLNSWWVDKEIQKALMKEEQLWKERNKEVLVIIPLNLDGHLLRPEWQDWKKQHLTSRLAADFTGWEESNAKFVEQFEQVVKALRADAGAREQPPKPRL